MANKIDQYISLEEFAWNSKVKISTIKKRYKEIPGIEKCNNGFRVLSGTRYPYNMRNSKIRSHQEKAIVLLKAIANYSYISHKELRLDELQFQQLLEQMVTEGFIKQNGSPNRYGANGYNCTWKGSEFITTNKSKLKRNMEQLVGKAMGMFMQVAMDRLIIN